MIFKYLLTSIIRGGKHMAFIKSALEIALERTEGLKGDTRGLRIKELQNKGRKAASNFLFSTSTTAKNLADTLQEVPKPDRNHFKEGMKKAFFLNLTLPKTDDFGEFLDHLAEGLQILSKDKKKIVLFMEQLKSFFNQYRDNKTQLLEAVKQQYAPRLRQKEQELAQRTGQEIHLAPEQDPEFMDFLRQNVAKLDSQFSESLDQIKKELEGYLT